MPEKILERLRATDNRLLQELQNELEQVESFIRNCHEENMLTVLEKKLERLKLQVQRYNDIISDTKKTRH